MSGGASVSLATLDVPTLSFVAVFIAALLGLFLIFAWVQQRDVRALAWWGAAYLIGASGLAMWGAPKPLFVFPRELPFAMIFVGCGMIWNGVRLFRGRPLLPIAAFVGAVVWLIACQFALFRDGSMAHFALGAAVVSTYTFFIAYELSRERRKSLYSRTVAVIVPSLHATIFLIPLAMRAFLPEAISASWLPVFALETILYAVGTAFIVLVMVKDYDVGVYRSAASTDFLTGLLNRRAFLDHARNLCARQAKRGRPVTVLMFDLDHFKSVNDRFGHLVGDDVLRLFAEVARSSMRANDIIGRLGGEEFAAIVPAELEVASRIAERIRSNFEKAGTSISAKAIGATVSIGAAAACAPVMEIGPLLVRADAALYRAKNDGRNRLFAASDKLSGDPTRLTTPARSVKLEQLPISEVSRRNAA